MNKQFNFSINIEDIDVDFTTSLELVLLTEVAYRNIWEINFSTLKGFVEGITDENNQLFLDKITKFAEFMDHYGDNKPFVVDFIEGKILIRQDVINQHFYCLLLLLGYEGVKFKNNIVTKCFEKITAEAIPFFFKGSTTEIVGAPSTISSAEDVANFLQVPRIRSYSCHAKDKGLDVVSFLSTDKRTNKFVVLTQCAAGKNWEHKINDIDVVTLSRYIAFSTYPLKTFAMPSIYYFGDYPEKEEEVGFGAGVIFDRPRIYSLLHNNIVAGVENEARQLFEERISYYRLT